MSNSSRNRRPTLTADPRPADSSLDRQGTYSSGYTGRPSEGPAEQHGGSQTCEQAEKARQRHSAEARGSRATSFWEFTPAEARMILKTVGAWSAVVILTMIFIGALL